MLHVEEKEMFNTSGFAVLLAMIVVGLLVLMSRNPLLIMVAGVAGFVLLTGFAVINPNESKVVSFFGSYLGTMRDSGFRWTIPLTSSVSVSLKYNNYVTATMKVNDLRGNPVEIAAVIVWHVIDPAQAVFNVDRYGSYVESQGEMAIRSIAARYAYDAVDGPSLRGNTHEIVETLEKELDAKLSIAGISISEVRISHLAYAPEIASAMLRRQQAEALSQARAYLVENALSIIDSVLKHFETAQLGAMSDDSKARLVSNLLVTLVADKEASPVVNVG